MSELVSMLEPAASKPCASWAIPPVGWIISTRRWP